MVSEAARLHFTLFAPCRFAAIAKALHSKAQGFSSHLHRSPGEALLVKTLPPVACLSRHSLWRRRMKSFALLTCEVFSLREYGWCRVSHAAPRIPRGMRARIGRLLRKLPYFSVAFFHLGLYIIMCSCVGRCANRENAVQTMKFVLKQYDTELISFDLWSEEIGRAHV